MSLASRFLASSICARLSLDGDSPSIFSSSSISPSNSVNGSRQFIMYKKPLFNQLARTSHTPRSQATTKGIRRHRVIGRCKIVTPTSIEMRSTRREGRNSALRRGKMTSTQVSGQTSPLIPRDPLVLRATQQSCGYAFFRFPRIWKKAC